MCQLVAVFVWKALMIYYKFVILLTIKNLSEQSSKGLFYKSMYNKQIANSVLKDHAR